jgi:hypothetical protein
MSYIYTPLSLPFHSTQITPLKAIKTYFLLKKTQTTSSPDTFKKEGSREAAEEKKSKLCPTSYYLVLANGKSLTSCFEYYL